MTDQRYMRPSHDKTIPRGIRNCNPLNVERNQTAWLGALAERDQLEYDERFIVFGDPIHGIRCPARTLLNYQEHHRLRTVGEMVNRWAPPSENVTSAYVVAVANAMAIGFDEPVVLRANANIFLRMLRAMCKHENGMCPYDDEDVFIPAMKLAGVDVSAIVSSSFANGFDGDIAQ